MAINYTPDQQKVIDCGGKNILVSAAAGSGKTAVLVERIVRIITVGQVDIDRLLVVTFTNMAADEMRERIGLAIGRRLEQEPENVHLQRQMTLVHNAQITTIDSFCLFILRNHFHVIDLDPGFRVADEGELKLLAQEVMAELLEDWYGKNDPAFIACAEYFATGSRDRQLEEYIVLLYKFAMSFPWPEDWLKERKGDYAAADVPALKESDWGRYLKGYLDELLDGCMEELAAGLAVCGQPDGPYMYGEVLAAEAAMLGQVRTAGDLSEYAARWPGIIFGRLPSKKDDTVAVAKREQVQGIRNRVKAIVGETAEKFFTLSPEQTVSRMAVINEAVTVLLELVLAYKVRLDAAKRDKNIIDFNDMEHFALDILLEKTAGRERPTAAARELRAHFAEILIDEYQDSNPVQELLLKSISGEDEGRFNRFMVGDVKQSIYRFRLARPEIFMEKYRQYGASDGGGNDGGGDGGNDGGGGNNGCIGGGNNGGGGDCKGDCGDRIDLRQNFRSRTEVLDSVNYAFSRLMRESLGGVAYDRQAALYPGAVYPEQDEAHCGTNQTELLLLDMSEAKDAAVYPQESARELEARMIARRIRELTAEFKVTDRASGQLRLARFGDMVILLRTNSGWDEVFKRILEEEGVPVHTAAKTGYFATTEIKTVLQVIRILDNPRQDIPLFGVLKSFFGGMHEEEIVRLNAALGEAGSLYDKLAGLAARALADERSVAEAADTAEAAGTAEAADTAEAAGTAEAVDTAEAAGKAEVTDSVYISKVARFFGWLETFREKAVYVPIQDLLKELIIDSGYYHYCAVLPAGEQRAANLEMLLVKAASFAQTSYYGLFHFVRYIEQLEKYDVDYGEANLSDEQADVVRLMSIHKSKGLEFPICFVAGLAKGFNLQDSYGGLIADVDLGLGADYVNAGLRVKSSSLRKNVIAQKMKLDSLGEELRVLYVAMTRAREKLILAGGVKKALTDAGGAERLSFLKIAEAKSFLEWLLPVVLGEGGAEYFALRRVGPEQLLAAELTDRVVRITRRKELMQAIMESDTALSRSETGKMTELSERFARSYPSGYLARLYTKTTVSELKKAVPAVYVAPDEINGDIFKQRWYEEPEIVPYIPLFMKGQADVTGTVRGSAYHKVMELLDFGEILRTDEERMADEPQNQERMAGEPQNLERMAGELHNEERMADASYNEERAAVRKPELYAAFFDGPETKARGNIKGALNKQKLSKQELNKQELRKRELLRKKMIEQELTGQIEKAYAAGKLSQEYREAVRTEKIADFMLTPLAARMAAAARAGVLKKEQPFVIGWPANRLEEEFPPEETIMIEGIIDVFFEEDGMLVVMDYKTDAVKRPEELRERYQKQLDYYAEALTQLTQKVVKEKIIYSFALNCEVVV